MKTGDVFLWRWRKDEFIPFNRSKIEMISKDGQFLLTEGTSEMTSRWMRINELDIQLLFSRDDRKEKNYE